jgi:hypothetical protein
MTWQVDVLRFGLLGVGEPVTVLAEGAAFCAFTAVALAFAARTLGRAG